MFLSIEVVIDEDEDEFEYREVEIESDDEDEQEEDDNLYTTIRSVKKNNNNNGTLSRGNFYPKKCMIIIAFIGVIITMKSLII